MHAVVVEFDHLSVDFLGCYGNSWIETPYLDRLASSAVTFDNCFAAVPPPSSDPNYRSATGPDHDRLELISALGEAGVRVSLCSEDDADDSILGHSDRSIHVKGSDAPEAPAAERPFRKLIDAAIALLDEPSASSTPSLLWIASRGVPSPWLPPAEVAGAYWDEFFDEREFNLLLSSLTEENDKDRASSRSRTTDDRLASGLAELSTAGLFHRFQTSASRELTNLNRAVYAAYVSAIDAWLGLLLDRLDVEHTADWLLIVTGRAGDLLGTHPAIADGCPPLLDPHLRVPLLIHRSGAEHWGTRRRRLAGTPDVFATLADWFKIDMQPPTEDSISLLPAVAGSHHAPRRECVFSGGADVGWSVRTPEFRCVIGEARHGGDPPEETWLFLKPDDVADMLNVADQYPDVTSSLRDRIEEQFNQISRRSARDE